MARISRVASQENERIEASHNVEFSECSEGPDCPRCLEAEEEYLDRMLETAEQIPFSEYSGPLYCSCCNAHFDTLVEFNAAHSDGEPRTWAWASTREQLRLDAASLLSKVGFAAAGSFALNSLQAALDAWSEKVRPCVYERDLSKVIVLPQLNQPLAEA